jgi:hypothetical protein
MANSVGGGGVFISGEKTVTTSGTALALESTFKLARSLTIRAKAGNTNQIYVGGPDVTTSTNDGLDSGESLSINPVQGIDLSLVFIDVDTDGEGVDFYAVR